VKGKLSIIVIVALGLLGGAGWLVKGRGGSKAEAIIRTAEVDRGDVVTSVTANGTLEPLTTVELKSRAGGRVIEMKVDVGAAVKQGELLAKIDPADSMTSVRTAQADLDAANARREQALVTLSQEQKTIQTDIAQAIQALASSNARLSQAEQQAQSQPAKTAAALKQSESARDSAKVSYDLAVANLKRQQDLFGKGFVPESAVETAQADVDRARAGYAQALASLDATKANSIEDQMRELDLAAARAAVKQSEMALEAANDRASTVKIREADVRSADAQIQRARATLQNAQTQLDDTTIMAPRDGVILQKLVEQGTFISSGMSSVSAGTTLFVLGDVSQMFAVVEVDETDIGAIDLGQAVEITVDAFPLQIFDGKVTKIEPVAEQVQNVTVVRVTVGIDTPPAFLKPKMNATCAFIVEKKEDVLRVPVQAIQRRDGKTTVRVQTDKTKGIAGLEDRTVEVGLEGNDNAEIKSGLKEGETVVTSVVDSSITTTSSNAPRGASPFSPMPRPAGGGGGGRR